MIYKEKNMFPFKYKYEIVDWYVNNRGWNKSVANSFTKKQLIAIYFTLIKKEKSDA